VRSDAAASQSGWLSGGAKRARQRAPDRRPSFARPNLHHSERSPLPERDRVPGLPVRHGGAEGRWVGRSPVGSFESKGEHSVPPVEPGPSELAEPICRSRNSASAHSGQFCVGDLPKEDERGRETEPHGRRYSAANPIRRRPWPGHTERRLRFAGVFFGWREGVKHADRTTPSPRLRV
jgi:hypothetical protein